MPVFLARFLAFSVVSACVQGVRAKEATSRFTTSLGVDVTNAYYFRGIRQENDGVIVQPWAEVGVRLHRWDSGDVSFVAGVWNSVHGDTGTAAPDASTPNWYEADFYLGPTVTLGRWSLGAAYTWYTSPSDAFNTVEEVSFSLGYDDAEAPLFFGATLNPHATVAIELGDDAADGADTGVYLELGVEPAVAFEEGLLGGASLAFPVTVGLSLDEYYEAGGDSDVFGYAEFGARLDLPVPVDGSWGAWTLSLGVHALTLGDAASELNGGDDVELVLRAGVSGSF